MAIVGVVASSRLFSRATFLTTRRASPRLRRRIHVCDIAVTEEMCTTTTAVAAAETETESENTPHECSEESKQDAPAPAAHVDEDSMTCRICLSGYKVSLAYMHTNSYVVL